MVNDKAPNTHSSPDIPLGVREKALIINHYLRLPDYFKVIKASETAAGTAAEIPADESFPRLFLNTVMLSESLLATKINSSVTKKLRGVFPPVGCCPFSFTFPSLPTEKTDNTFAPRFDIKRLPLPSR